MRIMFTFEDRDHKSVGKMLISGAVLNLYNHEW